VRAGWFEPSLFYYSTSLWVLLLWETSVELWIHRSSILANHRINLSIHLSPLLSMLNPQSPPDIDSTAIDNSCPLEIGICVLVRSFWIWTRINNQLFALGIEMVAPFLNGEPHIFDLCQLLIALGIQTNRSFHHWDHLPLFSLLGKIFTSTALIDQQLNDLETHRTHHTMCYWIRPCSRWKE